jgi:hypothetical protein
MQGTFIPLMVAWDRTSYIVIEIEPFVRPQGEKNKNK